MGRAPGAPSLTAQWVLAELPPGNRTLLLGNVHATKQQLHAQQHAAPHQQVAPAAAAPHPQPPRRGHHPHAGRLNSQLQALRAPVWLRVLGDDDQLEEEEEEQHRQQAAAAATQQTQQQRQERRQSRWAERLRGLAVRVGDLTQPTGEAPGDATWGERTANVLTSLPFLLIGWRMHRQRLTPEGRHHARTLMAVGAAATLYHATSGTARKVARKVDYWTIAYSSAALVKSIYADSPGVCRAANLSLLAVPFRPFLVSCANAALMQAEFVRQAAKHKAVRADLQRHYTAAALGVGAFFAEELVMYSGWGGYVHSAWHCLAAYGVATLDGLLAHRERQQLQEHLRRGRCGGPSDSASSLGAGLGLGLGGGSLLGGLPAGKPLRRPVHSSASSLPSYASYGQGHALGRLAGGSPAGSSPAGCSPGLLSPPPGRASPRFAE